MIVVWVLVLLFVFSFFFVIFFGAPYLPILNESAHEAIEFLGLKPNKVVIDLGCGGGKFLREAARNNLYAVGYELNPILFIISYLSTRRWSSHVRVIYGNFWKKKLVDADAVYVFLLPKYMNKLDKKMQAYEHKPITLISYAFKIPNKIPSTQTKNLYIYKY